MRSPFGCGKLHEMHAREEVLGKQIAERNNFLIPLWQRRYSWTRPQWQSLWDDVLRQYAMDGRSGADAPRHFIGSLILHGLEKQHVSNPSPVLVVDGQQRLLTVLVLLAALRDHVLDSGSGSADEFELYLFNSQADGFMRYRLVPQESDREAFFSIMDGQPVADADPGVEPVESEEQAPEASDEVDEEPEEIVPPHTIRDAYRFFRDKLESTDWPSGLVPDGLISAIIDRLDIVAITLEGSDSYHRIFQTVNAEGVELRDVDLVRNYLFMLLGEDADDSYKAHWAPMESSLDRDFASFLLSSLVSMGEPATAQRKSVFAGYRRRIGPIEANPSKVREVLKTLEKDSHTFERVLARSSAIDSAARSVDARLRFLREWGSVPMQPLLLRLLTAKGLPEDDLVHALEALESLVVRRFLRRTPPNDLRSRFTAVTLRNVSTKSDVLVSRILEDFREEAARWPTDEDVRVAIEQVAVYDAPRAKQTFLVLKRLSSRVQSKEFPKHVSLGREAGSYQIEHVLPQDPKKWIGDLGGWGIEDIPTFLAAHTHTLPNLVLTAFNPDMSNNAFDVKRPLLGKSSIELTREVAEHERWGTDELQERASRLADLVIAEWPRN